MAKVRAMVVFQGRSNLPDDRYVNTWHFNNGAAYEDHIEAAEAVLDDFYGAPNATAAIDEWLSPVVNRTYQYQFYNLDDLEPREPTIVEKVAGASIGTQGAPEECCAVLSFRGVPPHSPRRRGRIYIGPLALNGIEEGTTLRYSGLHPSFVTDLTTAAEGARQVSIANLSGWSIRSTLPAENFVLVNDGWVDDAIDIQRRRGAEATQRVLWGNV